MLLNRKCLEVVVVVSRPACGACYVYRSAMMVSPSIVVLRFALSTTRPDRNINKTPATTGGTRCSQLIQKTDYSGKHKANVNNTYPVTRLTSFSIY